MASGTSSPSSSSSVLLPWPSLSVSRLSVASRGKASLTSSAPSPSSSVSVLSPVPSPSVSIVSVEFRGNASVASGTPSPSSSSSTRSGRPSPSKSGRPTSAPIAVTRVMALNRPSNWLADREPWANCVTPSRKSAWMVVSIAAACAPRGSMVPLLITVLKSAIVLATMSMLVSDAPNAVASRVLSVTETVRSMTASVAITVSKALAIAMVFSAAVTFWFSARVVVMNKPNCWLIRNSFCPAKLSAVAVSQGSVRVIAAGLMFKPKAVNTAAGVLLKVSNVETGLIMKSSSPRDSPNKASPGNSWPVAVSLPPRATTRASHRPVAGHTEPTSVTEK